MARTWPCSTAWRPSTSRACTSSTARSTIPSAIPCRPARPTTSCAWPSAMISWWSRTTPMPTCTRAAP
ncbi:Uncharacterised protein [Bordetella pertussis]|nr:Uncharacterised protein [Bordetella pertussis]